MLDKSLSSTVEQQDNANGSEESVISVDNSIMLYPTSQKSHPYQLQSEIVHFIIFQ
jgi:hypothetical protein